MESWSKYLWRRTLPEIKYDWVIATWKVFNNTFLSGIVDYSLCTCWPLIWNAHSIADTVGLYPEKIQTCKALIFSWYIQLSTKHWTILIPLISPLVGILAFLTQNYIPVLCWRHSPKAKFAEGENTPKYCLTISWIMVQYIAQWYELDT